MQPYHLHVLQFLGLLKVGPLSALFPRHSQDAIDALNDNYKSWAYFGDECWVVILPYFSQVSMTYRLYLVGPKMAFDIVIFSIKLHNVSMFVWYSLEPEPRVGHSQRNCWFSQSILRVQWCREIQPCANSNQSDLVESWTPKSHMSIQSGWMKIGCPISRIREEKDCKPMKVFIAPVDWAFWELPWLPSIHLGYTVQFLMVRSELRVKTYP